MKLEWFMPLTLTRISKLPLVRGVKCEEFYRRQSFVRDAEVSLKVSWKDITKFLDKIKLDLDIQAPDDWKRITKSIIRKRGGENFLKYYGNSIPSMLESAYPQHNWSFLQKHLHSSKPETVLHEVLEGLFPDTQVRFKHKGLAHSLSGADMELDFWVPTQQLAFEYQGEYHYKQSKSTAQGLADQQKRDAEKREACKNAGITLIEVPYWWDRTPEQIIATIKSRRPDLLSHYYLEDTIKEISARHPIKSVQEKWMTPMNWRSEANIDGWWMTKRHVDSIRLLWTGKNFVQVNESKNYNNFDAISIATMIECMPKFAVDGELVFKRKGSRECTFYVNDCPDLIDATYESRIAYLKSQSFIGKSNAQWSIKMAEPIMLRDQTHLLDELINVVENGSIEEILIRRPHSPHIPGRSEDLLRVKPYYLDLITIIKPQTHNSTYRYISSISPGIMSLHLRLPSESTLEIQEGSILLSRVDSLRSNAKPDVYLNFYQRVPVASIEDIVSYYLTLGNPIRTLEKNTRCFHCKNLLDNNDLRIETKGIFYPLERHRNPRWKVFSFCPSKSCLPMNSHNHIASMATARLPKFQFKVGVRGNVLKDVMKEKFDKMKLLCERERIELVREGPGTFINDQLYTLSAVGIK